MYLSHDVASGNDITPCNKIDKPLVLYEGHPINRENFLII